MTEEADPVRLRLEDRVVAEYVVNPMLEPTLAPRPYLHPVRTLGGTVVTDFMPDDHRHHLGASLAVQDVSKTNLWGGRTYVRDAGYTWLDDHGRIVHEGFDQRSDDHIVHRLRWLDQAGETLLTERRELQASLERDRDDAWVLSVTYTLKAPGRDVEIGSPVTNGRPHGAGYGGFFWRAPISADGPPEVLTAQGRGEAAVNGSAQPWVGLSGADFTLIFTGLADGDRWFVRASGYPGVCAALAYTHPRTITSGSSLSRRHRVVIIDGVDYDR
jgi:hypothetical protein